LAMNYQSLTSNCLALSFSEQFNCLIFCFIAVILLTRHLSMFCSCRVSVGRHDSYDQSYGNVAMTSPLHPAQLGSTASYSSLSSSLHCVKTDESFPR